MCDGIQRIFARPLDVSDRMRHSGDMENTNNATSKQIGFALSLLGKAGFSTRFMDSSFKRLGATMNQRSGTVENWLSKMNKQEISQLIDDLKNRTA